MSTPNEKNESTMEQAGVYKYQDDSELLAPDIRVAAERRLVRTLDMRLLPTIIVIYIMNYIDVNVYPFSRFARLRFWQMHV